MLAIKLKRIGKKKQASFRVVVSERRSKLNGRSVEDLGWVNPRTNTFNVVKDRVLHWIGVGAKPTDTVHNLLVRTGVIKGPKVPVHKKSRELAETSTTPAPEILVPVAEASPAAEVGTPSGSVESASESVPETVPAVPSVENVPAGESEPVLEKPPASTIVEPIKSS